MFYVYILKSLKDNKLYIGYTKDLRRRFEEHNSGQNTSTKFRRPFVLIYYEAYSKELDARLREINLKQFKNSYSKLKNRLVESLKT